MGYFVLTEKNGKWHFALKAANHETILSSETYESRAAAENGVASVRKNGTSDKAFEVKQSKDGQSYFVLKAGNGQIIGQSERYTSEASCKNGIASVQKNAADAEIKEA